MINTLFSGNEISKDRNHCICITGICIDSVLRVDNKNYPQVYLGQCKYKMKKRKPVDFIVDKVDLSSSAVFEIRTFHLVGYFSGNTEEPLNQNKRSKNQLWVWRSL